MNCAIYTRVSSEGQVTRGYSLEAQEKAGVTVCQQNGWNFTLFREAGRSADKENVNNRPELQKILDLAEDGKIDFCFVTELDRLSRNPVTLEYIKTIFRESDVKVVTLGGTYDFQDDENEFMADLLGLLAKRENRVRVKRSRRAILEGMKRGNWCLGSHLAPFGYMKEGKKLVVHPEESNVYKRIVEWSLQGNGCYKICTRLNEMGIKTRNTRTDRSFKWKDGTVLRILRNPFYKGEFLFKGERIEVPTLIDKDTWQRIQSQLQENYRNSKRNTKRFYLLRGLLYCQKCGQRFFGKIKESSHERLYCCLSKRSGYTNCGTRSVNLDKIDRVIWEKAREIAVNSAKLKEVIENQNNTSFVNVTELEIQIKDIEKLIEDKDHEIKDIVRKQAKLSSLTDEEVNHIISEIKSEKNNLIIRHMELNTELQQIQTAKAQSKYISDYLTTLAQNIDNFNDQERYDFLHLIINRIDIEWSKDKRDHKINIIFSIPMESGDVKTTSNCTNAILEAV